MCPRAIFKCLNEQGLGNSGLESAGGLSNASAPDSPSDEAADILTKLSPCSLHQMMYIQDCAHHLVEVVGDADRGAAFRGDAIGTCTNRHGEICED